MTASKNLVIVEDDPDIRALLERCLGTDGYNVTSLSAAAGLDEVLSAGDISLVIIDVGLPDSDGLTLTRRIRQHHNLGIIIVSGRGDLMDRVVGLEIGADDYYITEARSSRAICWPGFAASFAAVKASRPPLRPASRTANTVSTAASST